MNAEYQYQKMNRVPYSEDECKVAKLEVEYRMNLNFGA